MAKFCDICEVLNGYAFKSEKYISSGIRVIRIANVQKGYIEDTAPAFYPMDTPDIEKYFLYEDDLLISLTGNVGRVALLKKEFLPAALNQRVACLRLKDGAPYDKSFLYCYMNSDYFENKCIQSAKGVAQKNMSTEWLKEYEIPDLSLEEQKEIAIVLNKISELITARTQQLSTFDDIVKSRFIEMFGDPVVNPYKWETKPLLETGTCKNGMNFRYNDSGVELNCLGVGDFKEFSVIDDTSALPIVSLSEMPSSEYLLQDGDIVFVRSNGNKALVGRSVAVYPKDIPTTFSGFCIRYRKFDDTMTVPYLLRVLKSSSIRKKMMGRGANIQNLNQQILSTIVIPIPPLDLQNEFSTFVEHTDKLKFDCLSWIGKCRLNIID